MGAHTPPSDRTGSVADSTAESGPNSARDATQTDRCRTDGGVSDRTAASVFADLATDDDPVDTDAILGDTSPADLIDGSATPDPAIQAPSDLFDGEAFDDLLLSGRREGEEFLWVETPNSAPTSESVSDHPAEAETNRPIWADSDVGNGPDPAGHASEPLEGQGGTTADDADTAYEEIDLGSIFAGAADVSDDESGDDRDEDVSDGGTEGEASDVGEGSTDGEESDVRDGSTDGSGRVPPRTGLPPEQLDDISPTEPTPDDLSMEASRPDSTDPSSDPTDTERSSTESSSRIRSLFASLRSLVPGL